MACVQLLTNAVVTWLHCGMKSLAYKRSRDRKGLCKVQVSKSTEMSFRLLAEYTEKGVLAFQGQGPRCLYGQSDQQHTLRGTSLKCQLDGYSLGPYSVKAFLSWHLVFLTRQISEVLWDSAQASELPWDWITTGFSNLSLNPDSTISLCPWTNFIPSLSLCFLIFKGNKIIIYLYRLRGFQEIKFESTWPSSGHKVSAW